MSDEKRPVTDHEEAQAIHLVLREFPGSTAEEVKRSVMRTAIALAQGAQ